MLQRESRAYFLTKNMSEICHCRFAYNGVINALFTRYLPNNQHRDSIFSADFSSLRKNCTGGQGLKSHQKNLILLG